MKKPFEWPCDRRDAHHPHDLTEDHTAEECAALGRLFCPGVAAHPLTQIGGNYNEDEVSK